MHMRLPHLSYSILAWLALLSATAASASTGRLELQVVDAETGRPIACRMHLTGPKKRPFKPERVPYWHDHFALPGTIPLKLPLGEYSFVIERGLEYLDCRGHFTIQPFADDSKRIELRRFVDMAREGWWSGDLDVRRPARDIELLMEADDLHVAQAIAWRVGKPYAGRLPTGGALVRFDRDRFCHLLGGALAWPGNELLAFNLSEPPKLSEADPIRVLSALRQQQNVWIDASRPYWQDLPLWVAEGQMDSIQIAHGQLGRVSSAGDEGGGRPRDRVRLPDPWGNAQWSQAIYFHLLDCGLRIPPTAGSGSGESANPVGYNRVYVAVEGRLTYEKWWESLRAGRVMATNGPLLLPKVEGQPPGHVFQAEAGSKLELEIGLTLSTREPISYLEIVRDGRVEHSIPFEQYAKSGRLPKMLFDRSGWFLIRATTDNPRTYRFAMTGPYHVEIGGQRRISRASAQFFVDWVKELAARRQASDPQSLEAYRRAEAFWRDILSKANAE